jgi:molecular chaperone DnaK
MKLGEAMYKASQDDGGDAGGGGADAGGSRSAEDVVDADFEEIPEDERKKSA